MLKSYEAIYEHGQVRWLEEQPPIRSARIIVTILEETVPDESPHPEASLLATLGGSQPGLQPIPRRRYDS
jgi:hypothetical protein